ncbi:hypothetical protein BDBG_08370 [Blastomyces gilchristii SLH14081]|uniref:Uncharacterized protein n=1 Tax=Blastomyces gilchristii (strain SLH14081) TaxID=559298 RepID=A0A179V3B5_BLAGS|nr:uncharacterized protein BDBG_08370 [Blastomyces gilchristii SLH14081]OAT13102.1 hypothetical protein BDBG_08370 [Blastomyces gilchristii SLH14081]
MPEVPWRTIWSCHLTEEIAPDKRTPESGDFVADSHGHFGRIYTPTGVMGVEPHFWRMRGLLVTDPEKKYYPRAMISVAHDCNPDENRDNTVIRGEIISAVNVMQWRITIFSYWGRNVRIIQVHFDGKYSHMALSPFIDFDTLKQEYWDLLLRWRLCKPVGDTRVPTNSPPIRFPPPPLATPPAEENQSNSASSA